MMKDMPQCQKNKSAARGFTLIEMMVAMGIFIIVSMVSVSIFLTAIQNQRRDFQVQNLQDNARYLIEIMTKEIRMNQLIEEPLNIGESTVLRMKNQDSHNVRYRFENDSLTRIEKDSGGTIGVGEPGNPLNSSQVNISGKFYVVNPSVGEEQKRVTITMTLSPNPSVPGGPQITVQNTVTVRGNQ
jgi:prepilin-type N-terminal cleavage/methylation domain-containing protein